MHKPPSFAPVLYFQPEELASPPPWVATFDKVVQVPANLPSREKLLECLAGRFGFPHPFSLNWNVLSDALRDLSWLSEQQILLLHEDLPLENQPEELAQYVHILSNAQKNWEHSDQHILTLAFPTALRHRVRALLDHP